MVGIGDVLSIVAFLLGLGGTAWAMTVSMGLLFPDRVARGSEATKGAFVRGLGLLLVGIVGSALLGAPNPGGKLIGWVLLLGILAIAALGLASLSHIAGRRLTTLQPEMGPYPAFLRGAAFLITASLFPVLGWFLFAPVALVMSLGMGVSALRQPRAFSVEA